MKILEVTWFSHMLTTIGIVSIKNEIGQVKFYIGKVEGFDEEADTKFISEYGAKIDPENLIDFINRNKKQDETK